ncbi:hypothetical protein BDR03DRAFT_981717 [Suillus americanus]|nr:hypothetical protein BDR03DRAFT_981717 [Suillus americanus]
MEVAKLGGLYESKLRIGRQMRRDGMVVRITIGTKANEKTRAKSQLCNAEVEEIGGLRMYKLNCIVLGNDPNCIFPVDIAQTQTVGDFRKVIKDALKPQFDHVPANGLELWKSPHHPDTGAPSFGIANALQAEQATLGDCTRLGEWRYIFSSIERQRQLLLAGDCMRLVEV